MRSLLLFIFISLSIKTVAVFAVETDTSGYRLEIDLKNIVDDKVKVSVFPPAINIDTVIYNMPKIVPGTYAISNFGRFVNDFKAIGNDGQLLETKKLDDNRWSIANAKNLKVLVYEVSDSFDEPGAAGIFEPAGTNIDQGKNIVFNPFGFAGYFEGAKSLPYLIHIKKPTSFYGETSMKRVSTSDTLDIFFASDYFAYHDNPILYCNPDTASMMVGDTRIAIAVYSPKGIIKSVSVLDALRDIFPAAAEYLGGTLPVDKYSVLLYCSQGSTGTGSFGALEHNKSTVFVLPEAPIQALSSTIRNVVAHEFFHIVTPLNIHSVEIDDYNFMDPKMSEHLWLYEGTTEYAAHHMQLKEGLIDLTTFLDIMHDKLLAASDYDTGLAFTELSKKALAEHKDQYGNVYQKGALIGLALDLKLRKLSDGAYGTQELMRDLAKKYGANKPFNDDSLFSEIGQVSGYPEVTNFLEEYVAGSASLPLEELLGYAGIRYTDTTTENAVSGGNISIGYNPKTEKMVVVTDKGLDEFGEDLGFKSGDELIAWNGAEITLQNVQDVLNDFKANANEGDKVKVTVIREKPNGKEKIKVLKAKAQKTLSTRNDVLEIMPDASQEQLKIRKAWANTE